MLSLVLITLLWAFSFSLIGVYLAADVDPYIAVFVRMLLATLLLLPFFRWQSLSTSYALKLAGIGALQIGVMYILLYHAFIYLSVAEVLLFTIFTPLYITLIDEWLINRKPIPWRWWLAVALSVIGAAIIRYQQLDTGFITGFLLIQGANLAFAAGQVAYKRVATASANAQIAHYALFFLGALVVSGIATVLFADWSRQPSSAIHWGVLIWLGVVASGVGYLAWSMASKKVNIAQLATMNNMLIPAGLIVNFLFWGAELDWLQLLIGGAVIVSGVVIASRPARST